MLRFEEDDDRCEIARDILIKMGSTAVPSIPLKNPLFQKIV